MRADKFVPTMWQRVPPFGILKVRLVAEQGIAYAYSAFFDEDGNKLSQVGKSYIKTNSWGYPYFCKNRQRYYLSDFTKITTIQQG